MGHIVLTDEGGEVTSSGGRFLSAFGADLRSRTRRIFCQPCLDWSERRYHLKGLVGARILGRPSCGLTPRRLLFFLQCEVKRLARRVMSLRRINSVAIRAKRT